MILTAFIYQSSTENIEFTLYYVLIYGIIGPHRMSPPLNHESDYRWWYYVCVICFDDAI